MYICIYTRRMLFAARSMITVSGGLLHLLTKHCPLHAVKTFQSDSLSACPSCCPCCSSHTCANHLRREEPISMGPDSPEAATPLTPDQQRQQWMAAAETWVPGAAPTHPLALPSAPLWADDQFHILEMQTGRRPGHSRSSSLSGHEGQSSAAHPLDGR